MIPMRPHRDQWEAQPPRQYAQAVTFVMTVLAITSFAFSMRATAAVLPAKEALVSSPVEEGKDS